MQTGMANESVEKVYVLEGKAEDVLKTLFPSYETINEGDLSAENLLIEYDSLESVAGCYQP